MPTFRVSLVSSTVHPQAGVTPDGHLTRLAVFRIQGALGKSYRYEGTGGGKIFEDNCAVLERAGTVWVESDYPLNDQPDTAWKEKIVNLALLGTH